MKVIIAGGRNIVDFHLVNSAIQKSGFPITEVVCGDAPGVDTMGAKWAEAQSIPVKHFPADWKAHSKAAGPIRNQAMAEYGEALIAIWDGESRGTKNMIDEAKKRGLKVYVEFVPFPEVAT